MSVRTSAPAVWLLAAVLAACSGPVRTAQRSPAVTPTRTGTASAPSAGGTEVAVQGCEPRSLVPSGVEGVCGRRVVGALFAQLVTYHPPDWRPRWGPGAPDAVARSITSPDGRRWTIRLKEGWTFHNGDPVTAASFADAWNHAAYGPNAQAAAALFAPIEGFDALRCREPGCDPAGLDESLAGLRVRGEHTLEVTLERPRRSFPRRLGHVAFSPLPDEALEDLDAYREAPVGNGPLRMDGSWEHERAIRLRRYETYPGRPAASHRVELRLFGTRLAAWEALLAGDIDVLDDLPDGRLRQARRRAPGRLLQRSGTHYSFLVLPSYLPSLRDDRVARALSLALDRRAIIREQLGGTATPAGSLVPPGVRGGTGNGCGAACRHDPTEARRLLAAGGGLPENGLVLLHPRGADYQPVLRAVADQWTQALELPPGRVRLRSLPVPAFLAHLEDRRGQGPYRMGWPMDLPSPRNFLQPLHGRGGLLNLDGYRNPTFQRLLARADRTTDPAARRRLYRRAERAVREDWHHIPLWFDTDEAFHSERVTGVALGPFGHVRLARLAPVSGRDSGSPTGEEPG